MNVDDINKFQNYSFASKRVSNPMDPTYGYRYD